MIIKWEMSIGFPSAKQRGEAEIEESELAGMTEEEREEYINEAIWEDAMQYVDVYPIEEGE